MKIIVEFEVKNAVTRENAKKLAKAVLDEGINTLNQDYAAFAEQHALDERLARIICITWKIVKEQGYEE